jgi:hypothetical protein
MTATGIDPTDKPQDRLRVRPSRVPNRRRDRRAVLRRVRTLRVTPVYVVLVLGVWAALCVGAGAAARDAVVHANSTNVSNLLHGRFYTLLTSAVLLEGRACLLAVLALGVVLGIGELAWGRVDVIGVFLSGHIVASLLVSGGLAAGISLHHLCQRLATVADVGVSYGTMAVLGALLVSGRLRRPAWWQLTAVVLAVTVTLIDRTSTDAGHLTSLLLGFATGQAQRRRTAQAGSAPGPVDAAVAGEIRTGR